METHSATPNEHQQWQLLRMSEAYWHVGGLTEQPGDGEKTAMDFLDAGDADDLKDQYKRRPALMAYLERL